MLTAVNGLVLLPLLVAGLVFAGWFLWSAPHLRDTTPERDETDQLPALARALHPARSASAPHWCQFAVGPRHPDYGPTRRAPVPFYRRCAEHRSEFSEWEQIGELTLNDEERQALARQLTNG